MACTRPLTAWQLEDGSIVFSERGNIRRELTLPCGQCMDCRLNRSRQWAIRCVHEAQLYLFNSFVTLTYNDNSLPPNQSLDYKDYQLFMRRLRKHYPGVRFYMCGEYGSELGRPHFHAALFNCHFADRKFFRSLPSGANIYTSSQLSTLWPQGHSSIGDVTFESAAYIARYICKKITGPASAAHYNRLDSDTGELIPITPEFTHMSLKPGIGAEWFRRYRTDVYNSESDQDSVIIRGVKMRPPRYYDNILKSAQDFEYDYIQHLRFEQAAKISPSERSPERLAVREACTKARLNFKKRTIL